MEVLETVGVRVESPDGLRILEEAGADVDFEKHLARIPEPIVREAISKTPSRFNLYGRDSKCFVRFEDGEVHFADGAVPRFVQDLDGKRRLATLRDVAEITRLCDALDYPEVLVAGVFPGDVPEQVHHVHTFLTRLENTVKPAFYLYYAQGARTAKDLIRMASVASRGIENLRRKPTLIGWENPVSPLSHSKEMTEMVIEFAREGLPVHIGPAIQAGATGPVSLAGVLVQQNAENLSGIAVAQFAAQPKQRPPILYGAVPAIADARYATMCYGSPEAALMSAASTQVARFYNLPNRGNAMTESKTLDVQAGFEAATSLVMCALSGANIIVNSAGGSLEPGVASISYEKIVVDNEICGFVERLLRGLDVGSETLALETISKVGPGGHYLSEPHTLRLIRNEHYIPTITDRRDFESWFKDGAKELRHKAQAKVKEILAKHKVPPLEQDIKSELQEIVKEVEARELK